MVREEKAVRYLQVVLCDLLQKNKMQYSVFECLIKTGISDLPSN